MNRFVFRLSYSWLLAAALAMTLALTPGCGSSASQSAPAPDTAPTAEAAQPAGSIPVTTAEDSARTQALEERVRDLEAQLERREVQTPARRPSPPAPPVR